MGNEERRGDRHGALAFLKLINHIGSPVKGPIDTEKVGAVVA